jgi:hypothetical protein
LTPDQLRGLHALGVRRLSLTKEAIDALRGSLTSSFSSAPRYIATAQTTPELGQVAEIYGVKIFDESALNAENSKIIQFKSP